MASEVMETVEQESSEERRNNRSRRNELEQSWSEEKETYRLRRSPLNCPSMLNPRSMGSSKAEE